MIILDAFKGRKKYRKKKEICQNCILRQSFKIQLDDEQDSVNMKKKI